MAVVRGWGMTRMSLTLKDFPTACDRGAARVPTLEVKRSRPPRSHGRKHTPLLLLWMDDPSIWNTFLGLGSTASEPSSALGLVEGGSASVLPGQGQSETGQCPTLVHPPRQAESAGKFMQSWSSDCVSVYGKKPSFPFFLLKLPLPFLIETTSEIPISVKIQMGQTALVPLARHCSKPPSLVFGLV